MKQVAVSVCGEKKNSLFQHITVIVVLYKKCIIMIHVVYVGRALSVHVCTKNETSF